MQKLLFIGSTVADVVLRVPHLPTTGEDINLLGQQVTLGGCAFNAFNAARLVGGSDAMLFSPVGSGVWGDWVRGALTERGVVSACPAPDAPNGCCYCLVEPDGERTFLCDHGAEYRFRPEWFATLGDAQFDAAYLCGLEVEEETGDVIIDYLTAHTPARLYFAPGPRIGHIQPEKMARLLRLHPVLHLNAQEAISFTTTNTVEAAGTLLHQVTGNDVIITQGADGACTFSDKMETIPAVPTPMVDAIGAGDAHIGALMAYQAQGLSLALAVKQANRMSAAVIGQPGAALTTDEWQHWQIVRKA